MTTPKRRSLLRLIFSCLCVTYVLLNLRLYGFRHFDFFLSYVALLVAIDGLLFFR